MPDESKSLDVFGIKPIADAAGHVAKASTDGLGAFLSRICLPAAEEFGLLLRDRVAELRAENTRKILEKSKKLYEDQHDGDGSTIHPRLLSAILNEGSWEDSDRVQSMWAGLISSSCSKEGNDQENLIFIRLLSNITPAQAILIEYACKKCKVYVGDTGLIHSEPIEVPRAELLSMFGSSDVYKLDVALDHLREIGIFSQESGLSAADDRNVIDASDMGLHFYARCCGFSGDVATFYKLERDSG